jgi:GxxExxY protein
MQHLTILEREEAIGKEIVDAAFHVHKELGPGLLEKVYESCMEYELTRRGLDIKRQVSIPIQYSDIVIREGLIIDILVNNKIIIELKSVEKFNPLWEAQIISHLKLTHLKLGFLINFNVPLIKQGIRRFINI